MVLEIILSILCMICIYVSWNLFRKVEELENANEEYSEWTDSINYKINNILNTIRELDSKKMFEDDDDVGSIYKQVSDTVKTLEEFINEK
jgi:predicted PurR-regulated permease PerM|tara:strand:- start:1251 stop:1520 length:270 start_codon:yes stop_codon:yes gene_type:complete